MDASRISPVTGEPARPTRIGFSDGRLANQIGGMAAELDVSGRKANSVGMCRLR
jgi:hypothetical protein